MTDVGFYTFNQTGSLLAVGASDGYRMYQCGNGFRNLFFHRMYTGVKLLALLHEHSLLAIVGDGSSPDFPPQRLVFWDDRAGAAVGALDCPAPPTAVALREDVCVVATASAAYIYDFNTLQVREVVDAPVFGTQVLALSSAPSGPIRVAFPHPSRERGYVTVMDLSETPTKNTAIGAHDHAVTCLTLSADGLLLATASSRGTLVRVFSAATGHQLGVYRRGKDAAAVCSLTFSADSSVLAVSAVGGTIWAFDTKEARKAAMVDGGGGRVRGWRQRLSLRNEGSFLRASVGGRNTAVLLSPVPNSTDIFAASSNGDLYRFIFDHSGHEHAVVRSGKFM